MRIPPSAHRIVCSLLEAYRSGAFPMADPETGELAFYTAQRRGVFSLTPGGFHVPRRLARTLNAGRFRITTDERFGEVVRACAAPRDDEDGVWINEELACLYDLLHEAGYAHSVEAWATDPETGATELAGGIFGVHVGAAFMGESMYHAPPPVGTDASKAALVHLVAHLRWRGFMLFDTQLTNPFLERFGCVEIERTAYEALLAEASAHEAAWAPFAPQWRDAL